MAGRGGTNGAQQHPSSSSSCMAQPLSGGGNSSGASPSSAIGSIAVSSVGSDVAPVQSRSEGGRSSSGCSFTALHLVLMVAVLLGLTATCAAIGLAMEWKLHQLLGAATALLSVLLAAFAMYCRVRSQRETAAGAREVELEMGSLGAKGPAATNPRLGELRPDDLVLDRDPFGVGQYGVVYRGWLQRTQVAVKALKPPKQGEQVTQRHINDLIEEIDIMRRVADHGGHTNIVDLCGYIRGNDPKLVLEFAANGDLRQHLLRMKTRKEEINDVVAADYCLQIAQGMRYIESCWVVHRDLAARNVLVAAGEVLKISDFGLARGVSHGFLKQGGYQAHVNRKSNNWAWRWTAPEGLREYKFTIKGDVWSFGIVIAEICSRADRPYEPRWSQLNAIEVITEFLPWLEDGERIPPGATWPKDLYAIARRCWEFEPKNRPSFQEIVKTLRKRGKSRWWWR